MPRVDCIMSHRVTRQERTNLRANVFSVSADAFLTTSSKVGSFHFSLFSAKNARWR